MCDLSDENLLKYYHCYKQLVRLHQEFEFGNNPPIPEVFSEKLCRSICNLLPSHTRDYDALNNNEKIEIKATGTEKGTTSINLTSEFDTVYWLVFDLDNDNLNITIIPRKNLPVKNEKRSNITLSKYSSGCKKRTFHLTINTISEIN